MRVFIVDDEPEQTENIVARVKMLFPDVKTLTAENVEEARNHLRVAQRDNAAIDIAVVDMGLGTGKAAIQVGLRLAEDVMHAFPACLVLRYTQYFEDEAVRESPRMRSIGYDVIVAKDPSEGLDALGKRMVEWWEHRLLVRAEALFGRDGAERAEEGSPPAAAPSGPWHHACGTIDANTLLKEITRYAKRFSEERRKEIERYVEFVKADGREQAVPHT